MKLTELTLEEGDALRIRLPSRHMVDILAREDGVFVVEGHAGPVGLKYSIQLTDRNDRASGVGSFRVEGRKT